MTCWKLKLIICAIIVVGCAITPSSKAEASDFEESSSVGKPALTNVVVSSTGRPATDSNAIFITTEAADGDANESNVTFTTVRPTTEVEDDLNVTITTGHGDSSSSAIPTSTTPRETFPPAPTEPSQRPFTEEPLPGDTQQANPPGWAIGLILIMVVTSVALTLIILVRRYCMRRRREERKYLLARSQEGFFFGESNSNFNENL